MMDDSIRRALAAALAEARVKSVSEWVDRHPGRHLWLEFYGDGKRLEVCAACGVIRRADDANTACKGIASVTARLDARGRR